MCSIKDSLEKYIIPLDIEKLNLTHDYQYSRKNKIELLNSNKIEVNELLIDPVTLDEKNFSKEQINILTHNEKELFSFGTKIHYVLENLDFINPDFSNIDLPTIYVDKIKSFLKTELFNNDIKEIYKEYDFIYEDKMGTIDLIIEYDNVIKVVDYKLKNINDISYSEQLKGYKSYLEKITNKEIELYLYSILDEKLERII